MTLSVYSFACRLDMAYVDHFSVGGFFNEVLLSVRGNRIQISARVLSFDKEDPQLCFFQMYNRSFQKKNSVASGNLSAEIKNKLYHYIRYCLREDIKERLDAYKKED